LRTNMMRLTKKALRERLRKLADCICTEARRNGHDYRRVAEGVPGFGLLDIQRSSLLSKRYVYVDATYTDKVRFRGRDYECFVPINEVDKAIAWIAAPGETLQSPRVFGIVDFGMS
jgi:hypothetical protein